MSKNSDETYMQFRDRLRKEIEKLLRSKEGDSVGELATCLLVKGLTKVEDIGGKPHIYVTASWRIVNAGQASCILWPRRQNAVKGNY